MELLFNSEAGRMTSTVTVASMVLCAVLGFLNLVLGIIYWGVGWSNKVDSCLLFSGFSVLSFTITLGKPTLGLYFTSIIKS